MSTRLFLVAGLMTLPGTAILSLAGVSYGRSMIFLAVGLLTFVIAAVAYHRPRGPEQPDS